MGKPTRTEMIDRAIELLDAGTLASVLPEALMDEFDVTPTQAHDIARAALKRKGYTSHNATK